MILLGTRKEVEATDLNEYVTANSDADERDALHRLAAQHAVLLGPVRVIKL